MLEKPAHGDACNGCGACCMEALCPLGSLVLHQVHGPCPALEEATGAYTCGLVANPEKYAPVKTAIHGREPMAAAARLLIGAGIGCDAQRSGEGRSRIFVTKMVTHRRKIGGLVPAALALWAESGR